VAYAALRWGAVLVVLGVLASQVWNGWGLLRGSIASGRLLPLGLAFVVGLAGLLALPLAWAVLVRGAGIRPVASAAEQGRIWLLSYLYRYVPGKVMLVAERTRLGSGVGIPPLAGAAVTVVESVLVVACGFACSLLALPALVDVQTLLLAALVLPVTVALTPPLLRVFGRSRIAARYGRSWPLLRYRDVGIAATLYVAFWLLQGLSLYLLCRGLIPAVQPPLGVLSGLYAFSFTAGVLAFFAPAGIGVREGVLAVGLQVVLAPPAAAMLALAARVWSTLIELVALGAFWALSRRRKCEPRGTG
jgi:uncharacterized membrane protein YbhN (UPF0104 family)